MILTGYAIQDAVADGDIKIDPYSPLRIRAEGPDDKGQINPASYDLRLGGKVAVYDQWVDSRHELGRDGVKDGRYLKRLDGDLAIMDVKQEPSTTVFTIGPEGWVLWPGIGYLMHTAERISTSKFVPIIDGKALALDTEIPTPNGWTTMGRLKRGDLVFGANGRPTRIMHATHPVQGRPCYELEFLDKTRVVADADHEWFVLPIDAKPGTRTTANMAARYNGRRRWSRFRVPSTPLHWDAATLPIAPYTLGAWLGDGTASNGNITSHNDDVRILREIRKDGYTVDVKHYKPEISTSIIDRKPGRRDVLGMMTANGSFHSTLKATGLFRNKHIPDAYKTASFEQRWSLLQGLMDTDGTVHRDDQASITLTHKRLLDDVEALCRSLGIITYRDERPAKVNGRVVGTAYRLTWRAVPELFRLPRKRNRVRRTAKWLKAARSPLRGIVDIKRVRSVPVRCITVEAADGMFLATRALIQTHNSSTGRLFIKVHETAGYGDPAFDGQYTLEVTAVHPIRLYAGMRIAQIRFHRMEGAVMPYRGNYMGEAAMGPVASRAWRQFR